MNRRLIISNSREDHRAWLYRVVYSGRVSLFSVVFLFISFFVQPIHQAYAAEAESGDEIENSVAADDVTEQQIEPTIVEPEPEPEESEIIADNVDTLDEENDVSEVVESVGSEDEEVEVSEGEEEEADASDLDDVSAEDVSEITASSTDSNMDSDDSEDIATSTLNVPDDLTATTTASTTQQTGGSSGGSSDDESDGDSLEDGSGSTETATSTDSEIEETENEPASTVATTTESDDSVLNQGEELDLDLEPAQVIEAEILINDENFYQFSKQSCVAVGDGTYHCTSGETNSYDTQSVVYSTLGVNGNLEIFLETANGDVRQITDNEFDDSSPYYDAETLRVVWQRLIDGRHQIILYDIETNEESQLTFSRTNNMEPKVSVDGVVWQAWDNNDWEIMHFDGRFTDQITENDIQDVAPTIQDRYVLWTVIGRGEQEAKVYSLDSEEILTISGYDGGVIENPRFVLVYDTKFENGDIITQGFDPATGISEPIAAKAAPDPIDIPLPDPIGEIRALIQNKSTHEDELEQELIQSDTASSSATTSPDTLDLATDDEEFATTSINTIDNEVFELTEFDLILTETNIDFTALEEIDEILEEELENEENSNTQD